MEEDDAENVPNEMKREKTLPQLLRRGARRRMGKFGAQDDPRSQDVVECEDVLRSLTKSAIVSSSEDGYCQEPAVYESGVHFLTSENLLSFIQSTNEDTNHSSSSAPFASSPFPSLAYDEASTFPSFRFEDATNPLEDDILTRKDLLEYLMNPDGSCVCKLCGEILASRTHWYRHKYKVHTPTHLTPSPAPLVESKPSDLHSCGDCKQYFKSKKGYLGHLALKHNEVESTAQPTPECSAQVTPLARSSESLMSTILEEKDYSKQRELEEQMVKDIIAKVKRECEAQGDEGMMRKGYTKKMRK